MEMHWMNVFIYDGLVNVIHGYQNFQEKLIGKCKITNSNSYEISFRSVESRYYPQITLSTNAAVSQPLIVNEKIWIEKKSISFPFVDDTEKTSSSIYNSKLYSTTI